MSAEDSKSSTTKNADSVVPPLSKELTADDIFKMLDQLSRQQGFKMRNDDPIIPVLVAQHKLDRLNQNEIRNLLYTYYGDFSDKAIRIGRANRASLERENQKLALQQAKAFNEMVQGEEKRRIARFNDLISSASTTMAATAGEIRRAMQLYKLSILLCTSVNIAVAAVLIYALLTKLV